MECLPIERFDEEQRRLEVCDGEPAHPATERAPLGEERYNVDVDRVAAALAVCGPGGRLVIEKTRSKRVTFALARACGRRSEVLA